MLSLLIMVVLRNNLELVETMLSRGFGSTAPMVQRELEIPFRRNQSLCARLNMSRSAEKHDHDFCLAIRKTAKQ